MCIHAPRKRTVILDRISIESAQPSSLALALMSGALAMSIEVDKHVAELQFSVSHAYADRVYVYKR